MNGKMQRWSKINEQVCLGLSKAILRFASKDHEGAAKLLVSCEARRKLGREAHVVSSKPMTASFRGGMDPFTAPDKLSHCKGAFCAATKDRNRQTVHIAIHDERNQKPAWENSPIRQYEKTPHDKDSESARLLPAVHW